MRKTKINPLNDREEEVNESTKAHRVLEIAKLQDVGKVEIHLGDSHNTIVLVNPDNVSDKYRDRKIKVFENCHFKR